jgi:hypothetical protein
MKIIDNKAYVESLAEWETVAKNIFRREPGREPTNIFDATILDLWHQKKEQKIVFSKSDIEKALNFKRTNSDNHFHFDSSDLKYHKDSLPFYFNTTCVYLYPNFKKRENGIDIYKLPVNALTINKTIGELYELGKWCELWE